MSTFCFRFDIGNPTRRFVVQALTLQNGAISIVIYLIALVLSLSAVDVEDRIHLQNKNPALWNNTDVSGCFEELFTCSPAWQHRLEYLVIIQHSTA